MLSKGQLISQIANSNPHLHKKDIELALTTFIDTITTSLVNGEDVELRGFGTFHTKKRRARVGRNPQNGQDVEIPEKITINFRSGKKIRDTLKDM